MSNAGHPWVREKVADFATRDIWAEVFRRRYRLTVGAGGAPNVVLKTNSGSGDEVDRAAPYFVEYNFYVDNHQGGGQIGRHQSRLHSESG